MPVLPAVLSQRNGQAKRRAGFGCRSISGGWPPLAYRRQLEMVVGRKRAGISQMKLQGSRNTEKEVCDGVREAPERASSVSHLRGMARALEAVVRRVDVVRIY